jgi:hypothetical protein
VFVLNSLTGWQPYDGSTCASLINSGGESASTLATIQAWTPFVEARGLEVARIAGGRLAEDTLTLSGGFVDVPFYTAIEGRKARLKRQCTMNYKVKPARRFYRQRLGLAVTVRLGAGIVEQWKGLTAGEEARVKESSVKWVRDEYPWLGMGWTRGDVEAFLRGFCERHGLCRCRAHSSRAGSARFGTTGRRWSRWSSGWWWGSTRRSGVCDGGRAGMGRCTCTGRVCRGGRCFGG